MMIESLRRRDLIMDTRLLIPGMESTDDISETNGDNAMRDLLSTPAIRELIPEIVDL